MRNKSLLSIYIMLIAVFLAGCSPQGYISNKDFSDTEFHTGTQALVMNFIEKSPPDRVYENQPLDIMLEYKNRGAFDISIGRIYLSGFDDTYIDPRPDYLPNLEVDGKSIFNPKGEITQTVTFTDNSIQLPQGVDKITQIIKATACYEYRTEASAEVCINPYTTTQALRENICQVRSVSLSGGQGAPVAVTDIEEEIYRNKLQFRIYFENVGGGTVIRPGAINNCHTSLQREDANKLEVRKVSFSGKTMRCEPANPINLDDRGKGFIFCYYEGNLGSDAYNTLLHIELDYGYRNSIQKSVEILSEPRI